MGPVHAEQRRAGRGAAAMGPDQPTGQSGPCDRSGQTALGEGLTEFPDPVDELEHEAGGHRVVRAAQVHDREDIGALDGDQAASADGASRKLAVARAADAAILARSDIGAIPDLRFPSQAIWRPRRIATASYWGK